MLSFGAAISAIIFTNEQPVKQEQSAADITFNYPSPAFKNEARSRLLFTVWLPRCFCRIPAQTLMKGHVPRTMCMHKVKVNK